MPMKVAYHSDAFAGRVGYGLGRYARELWHALRASAPDVSIVPFALRGKRDAFSAFGDDIKWNGAVRPRLDGRMYMAMWATLGAPGIERWIGNVDVVHSVELDYPVATRRPWIVTVHDLGPLTHPQYFSGSRPWLLRRAVRQLVRAASAIVAVSEATAESVEHFTGTALRSRMQVVPEGVNAEFFEPQGRDCLADLKSLAPAGEPYFLWTGSLNPRKNLKNVIRAFESVAAEIPHHLVLAGGIGWDSADVLTDIEHCAFRRRIHRPGHVTDAQLRALYQGADGFIYVSLMEGFGLPILEAMASGCPVITSNLSSMPEVAGDAALLITPRRHLEIAEAMHRLANDEVLRASLRQRGRERARGFSWPHCANRMIDLYRSVTPHAAARATAS
jgi:glycosyltransferase involved in cell wall biosynthesis